VRLYQVVAPRLGVEVPPLRTSSKTALDRLPAVRASDADRDPGDADLDLRQAELEHRVTTITAIVLLGNVDVYVPEGIEVDFGGLGTFGHRRESGRDVPGVPGTPLVRVRIFSLLGTADLWRVPAAWVGRPFREVINALRRPQGELPPPAAGNDS
jgi:hypothetical protein